MNLFLVLCAPPGHHADYVRELERKHLAPIAQRRDGWLAELRRVEIRRVRPAIGPARDGVGDRTVGRRRRGDRRHP